MNTSDRSKRTGAQEQLPVESIDPPHAGSLATRPAAELDETPGRLRPCRECSGTVSVQATQCPHCGAPYPAKPEWDGFGYEYKSKTTIFGIPLVHISFKYRANRQPVVAKGIVSIGQFGVGVVNISQFGLGVVSVGQFTAAGWAIAQFGFADQLIAQIGIYMSQGMGQFVWKLADLLSFL